ncbi:MAG: hypothetical protein AB1609_11880 [Bacillota bacterium]
MSVVPDVARFVWHVAENGVYVFRTRAVNTDYEDDYLTDGMPVRVASGYRQYEPLKTYTGLFRTFAHTPPTKEGIMAFAATYGLLNDPGKRKLIDFVDEEGRMGIARAEPLTFWRSQISLMSQAVELWDAVQAGDATTLGRRIVWKDVPGGTGVLYEPPRSEDSSRERPYTEWIAAPHVHPERLERLMRGDLVMPALYHIQSVVNANLKERVSVELVWDEPHTRLRLSIVPRSLIGALWLQFARAITDRKTYRRCEECGTWFEVSPGAARADRIYCSNACRTKAYRMRKARAQEMYAAGKAIREIAEALGSDEATVAGWVKEGT